MFSLSSIPEPSHGAPTQGPTEVAHHVPTAGAIDDPEGNKAAGQKDPDPHDEPEHQIDNLAVLLVLLIAGGLLRIVLGMLGPLQGIDPHDVEQARQRGQMILDGTPGGAAPLFDLFTLGTLSTGIPAWGVVLTGSLLTLIAIPAAYIVGHTLTGRRFPGLFAAAAVAVHPAVLTASNSFAGQSIALSLITIGLACVCCADNRGPRTALAGAGILGLAGLAAPLCWLVGALAGPLMYKLSLRRGTAKAFGLGLLTTVLAVAPAAAYRSTLLGTDTASLLAEWHGHQPQTNELAPTDRLLVTMTHTSFEALGEAMHLPLGDAGRLQVTPARPAQPAQDRDPVADTLADGWLLLNSALAGLAAISIGVMLARRRLAEVLVLTTPLAAMALCTLPPGETLRLPMLVLVGVLSMGLLSTRSVSLIDTEKREAKRQARLDKREQKERAKQERELEKHKESLYAFDRPGHGKKRNRPEAGTEPPETILPQHEQEAATPATRPI